MIPRTLSRFFAVLAFLIPTHGPAQTSAKIDSFYSSSLGSMTHYSYLLPNGYDSRHSYPVLYLLHGYGGDHRNWSKLTDLAMYAGQFGIVIIMPDAGNSWYVNSIGKPENRFEDMFVRDLLSHAEEQFSVDTSRRALAGLSMGGYGAMTLALRHPTLFRFAASLSGALSIPAGIEFPERYRPERSLANLREVFGPPGMFRDDHDPFRLVSRIPASSFPYLYLVMGTNDGFTSFLPAHRAFADSLRSYNARYEYHETPGGHSWKYWEREIRPLLRRMMEVLDNH